MKKFTIVVVTLSLIIIAALSFYKSPPKSVADPFWISTGGESTAQINHDAWQTILEDYLIEEEKPGINRFAYAEVDDEDRQTLDDYLAAMQAIDPRRYSVEEQQAYWINLYNALTVQLILDHYPVESITKLGETLTSFGPWDDQVASVARRSLSLNDIEHGILRPIWQDSRVHFAVNCASLGCPNLQAQAFSASNLERLLDKGAKDFLAHPRGMRFEGDKLVLSKIFDWYGEDFGDDDVELLQSLSLHAPEHLKQSLLSYRDSIQYEYDWALNDSE